MVPVQAEAAEKPRGEVVYNQVMKREGDARAAYWKALPRSDKRAFKRYVRPAYTERTVTSEPMVLAGGASPAAMGGCWTYSINDKAYSLLGTYLFTYRLVMDWCGKLGYIADLCDSCFGYQRPVDVALGWQFVRHSDFEQRGGLGKLSWQIYTQGEFRFCVVGDIGCLQHLYPWLQIKAFPNSQVQWWKSDV